MKTILKTLQNKLSFVESLGITHLIEFYKEEIRKEIEKINNTK